MIACRDIDKAEQAIIRIKANGGSGHLEAGLLDLASLESVKQFAATFTQNHQQLDLLINNAGVMMPPQSKTKEGYELQFGVNFIGHYALTGYLYPLLKNTPKSRVVTLSSGAHKWVSTIPFDNLKSEMTYDPNREYGVSKLADLMFTLELQRRIDKAGDNIISVAAHPGITRTDLQRHLGADTDAKLSKYPVIMQPWQGALPTLFAATSPDVQGGNYYGPDGEKELYGYPAPAEISEAAKDESVSKKLWSFAGHETGIIYP